MTTTLANQLPRINLANGGLLNGEPMQSAQVVTLKSGQQNASSVDSKSPMHLFEPPTSSTLRRCGLIGWRPAGRGGGAGAAARFPFAGSADTMTDSVSDATCLP